MKTEALQVKLQTFIHIHMIFTIVILEDNSQ